MRLLIGICALAAIVIPSDPERSEGESREPRTPRRAPFDRTAWDSVYSAPQAARGESLYVKTCARCHRASLSGGDESPPLAGSSFLANWNGETLNGFEVRIRTTMPSDSVGVLDRRVVTDVIAYLLKANSFPVGASELSSEPDSLRGIVIRAARP